LEEKITTPDYTITPRDDAEGFDRIDIDFPHARIGNVRCRFEGDTVIVFSIQIFPEFQGNGYGRETVNMLKERYRFIIADRVRFTARGFWNKMGFSELPDHNWEYRGFPKRQFTKLSE